MKKACLMNASKSGSIASVAVAILLVLSGPLRCAAREFTGRVVGISDGDTITVLLDGHEQVKIRLQGIDCPESGQPYGARAKQATSALCFGLTVRIEDLGKDRYGGTIADVYLPDGRILNQELVRAGLAWWYEKYAPHDQVLAQLEAQARTAKRGLSADPHPIAPWEWRVGAR